MDIAVLSGYPSGDMKPILINPKQHAALKRLAAKEKTTLKETSAEVIDLGIKAKKEEKKP